MHVTNTALIHLMYSEHALRCTLRFPGLLLARHQPFLLLHLVSRKQVTGPQLTFDWVLPLPPSRPS